MVNGRTDHEPGGVAGCQQAQEAPHPVIVQRGDEAGQKRRTSPARRRPTRGQ